LKPYWGKPTVRNFREGAGNVGYGRTRTPLRNRKSGDRKLPTYGCARLCSTRPSWDGADPQRTGLQGTPGTWGHGWGRGCPLVAPVFLDLPATWALRRLVLPAQKVEGGTTPYAAGAGPVRPRSPRVRTASSCCPSPSRQCGRRRNAGSPRASVSRPP